MPPDCPKVLILDEGELVEVRALLAEMGVAYAEEPEEECTGPGKGFSLLLSSPVRALTLRRFGGDPLAEGGCRLHVVVASASTQTLPPALADARCDLVLRQPLNPTVLRLLVQRASYEGPDRRRARRVALGVPVRVCAGEREFEALLAQLSGRGCGLVSDVAMEEGQRLWAEPSLDLTDGNVVRFEGRVCAVGSRAQGGDGGPYDVSVAFDPLDAQRRKAVRALMARTPADLALPARCSGAGEVAPVTGQVAPHGSLRPLREDETSAAERRGAARRRYRRRILGGTDGSACPLIGRDLSLGGMRVERDGALGLGDAVKLAIYGDASSRPVMVKAVVVRDDGLAGWFLRFEDVTPAAAEALGRLVDSLPAMRKAVDAPYGAGFVLSELVERL